MMKAKRFGFWSLSLLLLSGSAFAKGRPQRDVVLESPTHFSTDFGDFLIAPGPISVFTDQAGGLARGSLFGPKTLYNVSFPAGTRIGFSDFRRDSGQGGDVYFDFNSADGSNLRVAGLEIGAWIMFSKNGDLVSVETNLMQPARVFDLPLAPQPYFEYQCRGTDCQDIDRLLSYTLGDVGSVLGVQLPAGTVVDTIGLSGFTEIQPPADRRVQGILVRGGKDSMGNRNTFYVDASGRLRVFNAAEPTTLRGIVIPKNAYVSIREDGSIAQVGNIQFPRLATMLSGVDRGSNPVQLETLGRLEGAAAQGSF